MRYHLTAVRMAVKEKTRNNKCWRGYRGKRTLIRCRWVCILVQPLWERVWRFLKKLRIALPYDLAVPLPGTYPENSCAVPPACTAHFTAAPSKAAETHPGGHSAHLHPWCGRHAEGWAPRALEALGSWREGGQEGFQSPGPTWKGTPERQNYGREHPVLYVIIDAQHHREHKEDQDPCLPSAYT